MKNKVLLILFLSSSLWNNILGAECCEDKFLIYPEQESCAPRSDLYQIFLNDDLNNQICIFKNTCNTYYEGMAGERPNDDKPLTKFKGRSIHWGHFSFHGKIKVTVRVNKKISDDEIMIFPARHGIEISRSDEYTFSFVLERPGQYSVEIGENGYKQGLLIFADPMENDKPVNMSEWKIIDGADNNLTSIVSSEDTSLYFSKGNHDIGVYHVPDNIKNIYIEGGAWVYGSFIMSGKECSNVKIYGRGVLSGARLHLRESHMIEAKNSAERIVVNGIVIADYSFYAIRLLGTNNSVSWTKIVGGWIYNCDGIAAYADSEIRNCFIWANDDNIKLYKDNIIVKDVVCWQLDNGAIFQLNWGNSKARNCYISNVDIIRAEWDSDRFNNGIISCRNAGGEDIGFVFENISTDTPVSHIFRLSPQGGVKHLIKDFTFRNWKIIVDDSKGKMNYLEGSTQKHPISGLSFENFVVNGQVLDKINMGDILNVSIKNCKRIHFK